MGSAASLVALGHRGRQKEPSSLQAASVVILANRPTVTGNIGFPIASSRQRVMGSDSGRASIPMDPGDRNYVPQPIRVRLTTKLSR